MKTRLAILLASIILSFTNGGGDELLETCEVLGYGDKLRCSSCKHFEEIIDDPSEVAAVLYVQSAWCSIT